MGVFRHLGANLKKDEKMKSDVLVSEKIENDIKLSKKCKRRKRLEIITWSPVTSRCVHLIVTRILGYHLG